MKLKLLAITALLLAGRIVQADPLSVAVYGFNSNAGQVLPRDIMALITADLSVETNLVMVERAQLDKALQEQAFGLSGEISSGAAAKVGQLTGAKVLVAGRAIKSGDRLVIVANIIGTETGRQYASKVQGAADNLADLTASLSKKIAETITAQATNLLSPPLESQSERLDRIIKNITGTNRPSVSVSIMHSNGKAWRETAVEGEFGAILLKAGFEVVDENSDHKPDIQIVGTGFTSARSHHGGLFANAYSLDVKVQERRTGDILTYDHQESTGTDSGQAAANVAAEIKAVDDMAERLLPLLAK